MRGPAILHLWRAHMDAKSPHWENTSLISSRGQVRARVSPTLVTVEAFFAVREFATEPSRMNRLTVDDKGTMMTTAIAHFSPF